MTLLSEELLSCIGQEATFEAPDAIGHSSIRYFALAIGEDSPLYWNDEFASELGFPSAIAPPTFVCETNQYLHDRPSEDGYLGHRWNLPLAPCRVMLGEHEYEFYQPVLPRDRLTVTWRLADIRERPSRRGLPLLLISSEVTYRNQFGEILARNHETLIYEEKP